MISRWTILGVVGIALLAMGCNPNRPNRSEQDVSRKAAAAAAGNELPTQVTQALAHIDRAELISLEPLAAPTAPGDRLEGNLVLGAAKLSPKDTRAAGAMITSAVASFDGMIAACFEPRHALRFKSSGHNYLILICFECRSLQVFENGRLIGDAALTGSPAGLNKMLAEAKVPISRSAEERDAKYAREQEANQRRWQAGMPASVRPLWSYQFMGVGDDLRGLRAALTKEFPDPHDRIRALLGWYGFGAGPWSPSPSYEGVAQELLFDFSTPEIVRAIQESDLSDAQVEGASRFFADWEFAQRRPKDRAGLPRDLRERLLAHSVASADKDKVRRARRAFATPPT